MINRVLIRIKVIQILYSFYKGEGKDVANAEKELFFSLEKTYEMYFYLLMLVNEITAYAAKRIEREKNKFLATEAEKKQSLKFVQNKFAQQLANNQTLNQFKKDHNLSWEQHDFLFEELYSKILETEAYQNYMADADCSYAKDKDLWRALFKGVISDSETLGHEFEEMSIYWNDDAEVVVSFVMKTIKQFEESNAENQELISMFKDDEDRKYAYDLLRYALYNANDYKDMIFRNAKNWDPDRIAFMDVVIMQTAISEICNFPSIPVNVTMNEFIEISKSYSTPKSSTFINGILDSVVKELRASNKLVKAVSFVN
ncbi:MAG: transcription antitermination factor NusB [Paludibacteraceae bacterium]|nr:transcription antitermination factor NusB [Paludibacteraceae bacterium]